MTGVSVARFATSHQARSFALIGVLSTAAYLLMFAALQAVVSAQLANAIALITTAVANTGANRHLTFGIRGRASLARDHAAGLVAFGVALATTSSSIAVLGRLAPHSPRLLELAVLIGANGAATVIRFVLLRSWIGRGATSRQPMVERVMAS